MFDEYDIRNLNNGEIGKAIKVVFQDFFQYELTIRENIGFGNLARISHDLELQEVLDAGANIIVSGSGVFKGNITENTKRFMEILKRHE